MCRNNVTVGYNDRLFQLKVVILIIGIMAVTNYTISSISCIRRHAILMFG